MLEVSTRREGDVFVLTVTGEADLASGRFLKEAIDGAIADGAAEVVVDGSRITYLDSTMVRIVTSARQLVPLTITGLSPNLRRIFEVVGHPDLVRDSWPS